MSPNERFGHQPALDGLRAVSVVLVLLFHQGFGWMGGGYVGVSVFFTLSGYLITALLVLEHRESGRISVSSFYARRIRRLLPASALCLVGVAIGARAGMFPPVERLDRAIIGAVLQVANWEALSRHSSYASMLTGGATPVDHFWSLAVEEQFYWCWPVCAALIFRSARSRRRRTAIVAVVAAVAVAAGPVIAVVWGPDVAYLSTPSRLGEILTGAVLALLIGARPVPAFESRRWLGAVAGWVGLGSIVLAAMLLPSDRGPAYGGWLGVGSLATVVLLAALQSPGTVLRRALSVQPLRLLGRVSYGVYVLHWPVFLALRPGDSSWAMFAARTGLTLTLAAASYAVVEARVRNRGDSFGPSAAVAGALTGSIALLVAVVVPTGEPDFGADASTAAVASFGTVTGTLAPLATTPGTAGTDTTGSTVPIVPVLDTPARLFDLADVPVPSRPVRVLVVGDSTALALGVGLIRWAADHPDVMQVTSVASIGCGLIRGGDLDLAPAVATGCRRAMTETLPDLLASASPDVIVVFVSLVDAGPRMWDAAEGLLPSTDPRYARRLDDSYDAFVSDVLATTTAQVLFLTPTPPASWFFGRQVLDYPVEWWDAENAAIRRADAEARVHVADLATWIAVREARGSRAYRADGLHLSEDGAVLLIDEELADGIVATALGLLPDG